MKLCHGAYKAKTGILQKETVWANTAKMQLKAWHDMYVKPWHPQLAMVGTYVLSKLFLRPCISEIGLLTGICTQRSETGWSLQYSNSKKSGNM